MPILKYRQMEYIINEEQKELALLLDEYGWNPSTIASAIAVIKCPKDEDLPAPGEVIQAIDIASLKGWPITKICKAVLIEEVDLVPWLQWREDAFSKAKKAVEKGELTPLEGATIAFHLQGLTFEQMSKLKWKDIDLKNMKLSIPRGDGEDEEPLSIVDEPFELAG